MSATLPLLDASDALRLIEASFVPRPAEEVSLTDALGRVLAETIVPAHPVPPFDNAAMDGYAVRVADLPGDLRVVGESAAGPVALARVGAGEALRVMTGAAVPPGADAVVQQEWTQTLSDASVRVERSVAPGHNIRPAGGDLAAGVPALHPGAEFRPQEIGLLASVGRVSVRVAPRLRAAVLVTGNELSDAGAPLLPGMIHDSNGPLLAALLADGQLYELLQRFDENLAAESRACGCRLCGAVLHSARYRRKPRGFGILGFLFQAQRLQAAQAIQVTGDHG
mgnify:CR=1 FL=1